jgi:DNA-directed RNA polymerase subunit RPC12/RpoP
MSSAGTSAFECPTCGAQYKVVRVEAESVSANQQLVCRKCGGPLHGRDGRFILKYFLVDRPPQSARRARRLARDELWFSPALLYLSQC